MNSEGQEHPDSTAVTVEAFDFSDLNIDEAIESGVLDD